MKMLLTGLSLSNNNPAVIRHTVVERAILYSNTNTVTILKYFSTVNQATGIKKHFSNCSIVLKHHSG